MKSVIIVVVVAFLAAAACAAPVKGGPRAPSGKPSTGNATLGNSTRSHRSKRSCGEADLDRIQAKLIEALEKQIEQLLGGHAHEGGNKTRRSTSEAAAASKVDPDGTVKSVAAAKGSNDSEAPALFTNGHQLPPLDPAGSGRSGSPDEELPPPPPLAPTEPPVQASPASPHQNGGAPPLHPIAGTGSTVQKVVSTANMDKGTAVASAVAKRAAVLQTVDTSGGKAIANAEAHKGADTNVQSVSANGTHVGIANALVDNKNASGNGTHGGPEVVIQNVGATGSKAVATATNNKGSGSSVQDVIAAGDEISVASVVSARAKRALVYYTRGDFDDFEDDGSYAPEVDRILIRQRVARSPCISTKMDDNLRSLIHDTVTKVFADLKKEN